MNTEKFKYTGMECLVTRMQGKIVMRRELTSLSDKWYGYIIVEDS